MEWYERFKINQDVKVVKRDAIKAGTANCIKGGEGSPNHKLTEQDVRTIVYMWNTGLFLQKEIAKVYKIHQVHVSEIILKKTWKHIWGR